VLELIEKKEQYAAISNPNKGAGGGERPYTGLILVANPVDITPPYVEDVVPNSPAAKAGFKPDDLIVYVGGISVKTINSYYDLLTNYHANEKVPFVVRRGEKLVTLDVTLEKSRDLPRKPAPPPPAEKGPPGSPD
jgi:serine protease Do